MNIVDRIFIAFAFGMLIVFSFSTKYNVLEFFTLEEFFIVLCLYIIVWQLLTMVCDEILKRLNKPHIVKKDVTNGKLPKSKEIAFKLQLREDIAEYEPVAKPKAEDRDMSAMFDLLDKQSSKPKDKKPDFATMYRRLDEPEKKEVEK